MPIEKLLQSSQAKSALSGFLGGAAGGAVVNALTTKKSAKKLLKTGGLVALGGLAWHAVQKYRQGGDVQDEALPQSPAAAPAIEARAPLLLRAMVAAAHADGHLTGDEQKRIWEQAIAQGLDGAALGELEALLKEPPSTGALVSEAGDDLETRLEVYSASLLALDESCSAGQAHLEMLAASLRLPSPLVEAIHQNAAAA